MSVDRNVKRKESERKRFRRVRMILTARTGVVWVDSSGTRLVGILSMKSDDDFFVCIVIGSGYPVVLEICALIASPANEVAEVTVLETVVVFQIEDCRDDIQSLTVVIVLWQRRRFDLSRERIFIGWFELGDVENRMDM